VRPVLLGVCIGAVAVLAALWWRRYHVARVGAALAEGRPDR